LAALFLGNNPCITYTLNDSRLRLLRIVPIIILEIYRFDFASETGNIRRIPQKPFKNRENGQHWSWVIIRASLIRDVVGESVRECGGSNNETHKLQVDLAAFFICLKCSRLKSAESVCQSHLQWRWATHPFQKTVGARCPDGS